jgi:hypothetical protein
MKITKLLLNKNIFAFAICFAAFTAQAHDAAENKKETTVSIMIETNEGTKVVVAKIITSEQASQLFNTSVDEETSKNVEFIDETIFSINDTFYVIQVNDSEDNLNVIVETEKTATVTTTQDKTQTTNELLQNADLDLKTVNITVNVTINNNDSNDVTTTVVINTDESVNTDNSVEDESINTNNSIDESVNNDNSVEVEDESVHTDNSVLDESVNTDNSDDQATAQE